MTLNDLKNKSSMSELALIEKLESLLRESIKDELKESISKPLLEMTKGISSDFSPDYFRTRDLIQKIVKIVDES